VEVELKQNYPDAEITLNKSSGGIFDVKCNGTLIYSKQNIKGRRFPNEGEITKLIVQERSCL
jgi:selT/selW/selH-like putative selenoprotein